MLPEIPSTPTRRPLLRHDSNRTQRVETQRRQGANPPGLGVELSKLPRLSSRLPILSGQLETLDHVPNVA